MPKITFETFEFGKDIKYDNMFGKWRLWIFFVFLAKKIHKNLVDINKSLTFAIEIRKQTPE